jgi:phage terminase small subunit
MSTEHETNPTRPRGVTTASDGEASRVGAPELPKLPGRVLTPREQVFAYHYAESRNAMMAYRQAYEVNPKSNNRTVWEEANQVLRRPEVAREVRRLMDEMSDAAVLRAKEILQDLADIVTADPNDLIRIEVFNCRHCHGHEFKFQWADAMELARALDGYRNALAAFEAYRGKKPPPRPKPPADASGGFGYDFRAEPNRACPCCYGEGTQRVSAKDTTKLTPKALKLFKGVKQKADGSIEILMHDQMQARDMLIKMLGAYKGSTGPNGANANDPGPLPPTATADEAQRAYLKLL